MKYLHTSADTASNECTEYVGHVFAVISFCESRVFSKIEICGRRCTDGWYVVYSRYELVALEVHLLIYNAVPVISKLSPWFVEKTRELLRQKIVATLIWVCDFWLNSWRHRLMNIKSMGCRHNCELVFISKIFTCTSTFWWIDEKRHLPKQILSATHLFLAKINTIIHSINLDKCLLRLEPIQSGDNWFFGNSIKVYYIP